MFYTRLTSSDRRHESFLSRNFLEFGECGYKYVKDVKTQWIDVVMTDRTRDVLIDFFHDVTISLTLLVHIDDGRYCIVSILTHSLQVLNVSTEKIVPIPNVDDIQLQCDQDNITNNFDECRSNDEDILSTPDLWRSWMCVISSTTYLLCQWDRYPSIYWTVLMLSSFGEMLQSWYALEINLADHEDDTLYWPRKQKSEKT